MLAGLMIWNEWQTQKPRRESSMDREKFWRGLDCAINPEITWEIATISGIRVGTTGGSHYPEWHWLDPHDPSVPLETLIDGLEKLVPSAFVCPCAGPRKGYNVIRGYDWETGLICWKSDRRTAIIAAIGKLLEATNG